MKKRNTVAIIEGTNVSRYYDINIADIAEILENSKGDACLAVAHAFIYGYAMGQRATTKATGSHTKGETAKKVTGNKSHYQGTAGRTPRY